MKKIIMICVFIMAVIASQAAFATDAYISYEQDDNKVTVSGEFNQSIKAKNISVVITRKGTELTSQEYTQSSSKDFLELVENVVTDYQGKWSFDWYPSTVAHYTVKATDNSSGESVTSEFYYVEESRMEMINTAILSGTTEMLEKVFSDLITMYVLDFTKAEIDLLKQTSKIGTAIYYIRKDIKNPQDIFSEIDFAYQLAVFNETNNGFEQITEKMKKYAPIEKLDFYNEIKSKEIKDAVVERIASKILTTGYSGYNELFTQSIILAGIENVKLDTYAGSYLELLGNKTYQNATSSEKLKICSGVAKTAYDSIEALEKAIEEALKEDDTPKKPSGSGGGGGGGKVINPAKGTSTGLSNVDAPQTPVAEFKDVDKNHWAFVAISNLYDRKITQGYADNTYKPENNLTRAEAVTLLCRVFGVTASEETQTPFSDVSESDWFATYINAAKQAGYINGDGTMFHPDENITRQDFCVMIYRFTNQNTSGALLTYSDSDKVADYAVEAVGAMSSSGIINGFEDSSFRPNDYATRAQTAQMIYKYLLKYAM